MSNEMRGATATTIHRFRRLTQKRPHGWARSSAVRRSRTHAMCVVALATCIAGAAQLQAQERPVTTRGCTACTIEATQRFVFRTADPRVNIAFVPLQVFRDGTGRYFVLVHGELPLVFSSDGRFIRQLGRSGEGPGEFRAASFVTALPGDSLLVLDTRLLRASVFSPDLQFVRSVRLPFYASAARVLEWPGRVAVNGVSFSRGDAGWPLHLLDLSKPTATRLASFGDNDGAMRAGQNARLIRRFVAGGTDSFWAIQVLKYQVSHYSADGRVLTSVRREPTWFARESEWSLGSPRHPPYPALQTAAIRGDTLWVAVRVPRPDWEKAWSRTRASGAGEATRGRGPESTQLHMTRVEVIDLRNRTVIAARDFDGIIVNIDAQLRATIYDLDQGSEPRLHVLNLRLKRQE